MSPEFLDHSLAEENKGKRALVLIQGTGAVRAGQWARSVCINENLEQGSMLPFVDLCRNLSIPVLVMNPNMSIDPESKQTIPFSQSMDVHACFVWNFYVKESGFDQISIVAHSAGGGCLAAIQKTFAETFYNQVVNIAYTDSWTIGRDELNEEQRQFMWQKAKHYEASDKPVGTVLSENSQMHAVPQYSAGHTRHEYTTGTS